MWLFPSLLWIFFYFLRHHSPEFPVTYLIPPSQACRRKGVFEGGNLWLATVPISCLHSLTMVISHFTAPQLPPMNWWLLTPRLHPSSLSGFQTFLCNCLLSISTWVSCRHLKLSVWSYTLIFPSQTCSRVCLISANDPSIHLVTQVPLNSKFHWTMSILVTTNTVSGPHIADMYWYNKWRRQIGSLGFWVLLILLE